MMVALLPAKLNFFKNIPRSFFLVLVFALFVFVFLFLKILQEPEKTKFFVEYTSEHICSSPLKKILEYLKHSYLKNNNKMCQTFDQNIKISQKFKFH